MKGLSCLVAGISLLAPAHSVAAETCASVIPNGPYETLRSLSSGDMGLLLDQWLCTYEERTHKEANKDNLEIFLQYGNLHFGADKRLDSSWKNEHCKASKIKYGDTQLSYVDKMVADAGVVRLVTDCIIRTRQATGLRTKIFPVDDCHFTFRAWFLAPFKDEKAPRIESLKVENGQCDKLPAHARHGFSVGCLRYGRGAATVVLNVAGISNPGDQFASLPDIGPEPPKPVMQPRSIMKEKVFTIQKNQHYEQPTQPAGGGTLIRVPIGPVPGAIDSISVRGLNGEGCGSTHQCDPDKEKCGTLPGSVNEPVPTYYIAGPTASSWWWSDSSAPCKIKLAVEYKVAEKPICVANCDNAEAHVLWVKNKARTCPGPTEASTKTGH